jgi:hypothetical protein
MRTAQPDDPWRYDNRRGPLVPPTGSTDQSAILTEGFGIQLREFRLGHIRTYESKRGRETRLQVVNAEVSTLFGLLDAAGAGEEIRRLYQPQRAPDELSPEERASLPEPALRYIEKLEGELRELRARNDRTENRLRKVNWAKWTR